MNRDYYNSSNKVSLTDKEKLIEVADSEELKEFIKKSDTDELLNYENM